MTAAEHLLVLFSIVLGLGMTQLLQAIHNLIHPATRVRWHWLPAYWTVSIFISMVFWWWIMFFINQVDALPNFFGMMLILLGPVLLYLVAASALPDIRPGDSVDLLAFYLSNHKRFFGLAAIYVFSLWLQPLVFGWEIPIIQHVWAVLAIALLVTLYFSTNLRVHAVLALVNATMTVTSLATFWNRIG